MNDGLSIFVLRGGSCLALTEWVGSLEVGRQSEGDSEPFRSQPAGPGGLRRLVMAPQVGALPVSRRQLRIDAVSACQDPVSRTRARTRSVRVRGQRRATSPRSDRGPRPSGPDRASVAGHSLIERALSSMRSTPLVVPCPRGLGSSHAEAVATLVRGSVGSETIIKLADEHARSSSAHRLPPTNSSQQAARAVVEVGGTRQRGIPAQIREADWQVVAVARGQRRRYRVVPEPEHPGHVSARRSAHSGRCPAVTTPVTPYPLRRESGPGRTRLRQRRGADRCALRGAPRELRRSGSEPRRRRPGGPAGQQRGRSHRTQRAGGGRCTVARERFEAFFTPKLARQLDAHPDLLEDRKVEVTVLFADIHDFSRLAERLRSPDHRPVASRDADHPVGLRDRPRRRARRLHRRCDLGDVGCPRDAARSCESRLSRRDGHARCSAGAEPPATAPLRTLEVRLGIGINTGIASVGDVGSRRKFKYGPIGNTVNLASRVQGSHQAPGL